VIRVAVAAASAELAHVKEDVVFDRRRPVRGVSVLAAAEARFYPVLRGTIRDHVTAQRRSVPAVLRLQRDLTPSRRTRRCPTRSRPGRSLPRHRRIGQRVVVTRPVISPSSLVGRIDNHEESNPPMRILQFR